MFEKVEGDGDLNKCIFIESLFFFTALLNIVTGKQILE